MADIEPMVEVKRSNGCPLRCEPLRTLDELEQWSAECAKNWPPTKKLVQHVQLDDDHAAKVMVCHDMKGGYLDDDSLIGVCPKPDRYKFERWDLIDSFCYFSHHLVTVPPVSWIDEAHEHGVPVLGTFITEGDQGRQICERLLESVEKLEFFADQLATIAHEMNFEGWLLNIENPVPAEDVEYLIRFAECVTKRTREKVGPRSLVVWYDSVIDTGELLWQNKLNIKNQCFYSVCDAIYLNYAWSHGGLVKSCEKVRKTNRPINSVYVGVDVFGRGCFGGGGWNTKAAIDEVRRANRQLSLAIFAPGWVHEIECQQDHSKFDELNRKFWSGLGLSVRHIPKAPQPSAPNPTEEQTLLAN